MTKQDIINRIYSDPFYGMRFAINNNFVGLSQAIKNVTGISVNDPEIAYKTLVNLLKSGKKDQIQKIYDQTAYNNSADNYTGGLTEWFQSKSPANTQPTTTSGRISWEGVLAGLGTGLSTFVNFSTTTPAQIDEQKRIEAEKEEEERKRKNMILWIVLSIVGLGILFLIIFLATRKKKSQ